MTREGSATAQPACSFADLVLVRCADLGRRCAESRVMLARVRPSGPFELLTARAWARALGYLAEELSGKSLSELMQLDRAAASEVVAALLDEKDDRPLEVTLCCKDQRRKSFRLHRRFDPDEKTMFVVADELPFAAEQTRKDPGLRAVADERGRRLPERLEADLA